MCFGPASLASWPTPAKSLGLDQVSSHRNWYPSAY